MGWFSRSRDNSAAAPVGETQVAPSAASLGGDEFALDTLASVVRTYGKYGFDTRNVGRAQLERRCDACARHGSNGAPAPVGEQADDADGDDEGEAPRQLTALTLDQR